MKQAYFIVLAIALLYFPVAYGQAPGVKDSVGKDSVGKDSLRQDSSHVAERLILEHQRQTLIDSAIREQLQAELRDAAGNVARTRTLQAELNTVSLRDSLRRAEQMQRIEQLKQHAYAFPVVLNYDTLFFIYTKLGSFSAEERARAVSDRIEKLYKDYIFIPDSLRLVSTENGFEVIYNRDRGIASITQLDALWFNSTTDSLAKAYYNRISSSIVSERKANSLRNWIRRLALMAAVIIGLIVVVYLINKLFRRSAVFIRRHRERYLRGLTIRKIRLFTPQKMEQAALGANNILRIVSMVLAGYSSLLVLSGFFAVTERWTDTLLGWILTPAKSALHGIINFLPSLFTILVIYFIFRYAIKGVRYVSHEVGKGHIELKGFHPEWAQPTYNIIKFFMYAFMVVLIFPYLPGSESPAFRGVSVFLGVLFSFGSSSAITNLVAGMVITYMRPFKIGDRVKIGDITGDVLEKNMLVTRIRTIKNEDVTVPNATVLSSSTINYSANTGPENIGLILHTTVTIGYDVPWKEMHQALIDAAGRTALILKDPAPFVLQTGLDDFYVSYQLNAYTKEANKQAGIYSQMHQHIQDCCNEAGIEIMSPHYSAMRDGNMTTVPGDYLPEDYVAPAFKVQRDKDEDKGMKK
jgi:small-conductance mechanosensitive channel